MGSSPKRELAHGAMLRSRKQYKYMNSILLLPSLYQNIFASPLPPSAVTPHMASSLPLTPSASVCFLLAAAFRPNRLQCLTNSSFYCVTPFTHIRNTLRTSGMKKPTNLAGTEYSTYCTCQPKRMQAPLEHLYSRTGTVRHPSPLP